MRKTSLNSDISYMKQLIVLLLLLPVGAAAQTLDECQRLARRNYPLIKQHQLVEKTTAYTVQNLQKGWLPQLSASAQATLQSDVAAWPDNMKAMLQQMNVSIPGMKKDQYRVGIEVNQLVWDGGRTRQQKQIARLQGDVEQTETDVTLYQVAERVNQLYFGILLIEEKIQINNDLQKLLDENLKKLEAMLKQGTAMQSDVNSLKAEKLATAQTHTELTATRESMQRVLAQFCGLEQVKTVKPAAIPADVAAQENHRPELMLIDRQLKVADAQERMLQKSLMPRLSVFAQGYYGYPGYNMFESMMNRDWSLNGMIGARLTWNIGTLYTHKNDRAKLQQQRAMAENRRETFLFNNRLQQTEQATTVKKYRNLMSDDDAIISLRTQVRQSAESKLRHGIIDVSHLLQEITRENNAKTQRSSHEIEMLKALYDLKYTTNN